MVEQNMTQVTIETLSRRAEKLLALRTLVLRAEEDWYRDQLRQILIRLESFNTEIRKQYGLCLADILKLDRIPNDLEQLGNLIARIQEQLSHMPKTQKRTPSLSARYGFFQSA